MYFLLGHPCKLFTYVLNLCLQTFADEDKRINQYQGGIWKWFSIADDIFVMKLLADLLHNSRKKLLSKVVDLKGDLVPFKCQDCSKKLAYTIFVEYI